VIAWAGTALCLVGMACVSRKIRFGLLAGAVSCALWAYEGYQLESHQLVTLELVLLGMNLYGFWYWGRDES
jgi:nicotinamide riboside transporter PnuC